MVTASRLAPPKQNGTRPAALAGTAATGTGDYRPGTALPTVDPRGRLRPHRPPPAAEVTQGEKNLDAELAALAASGASSLVGLMVSDAWSAARDRVARLFARGGDEDQVAGELTAARAELAEADRNGDEEHRADIQEEWQLRLRRLLRSDPDAAAELRALLDEIAPAEPAAGGVVINNTVSGGTHHAPVIQVGQLGHGTFGSRG
nr:hypothetical protein [Streptomyces albidoflavus]